MLEQSYKAMKMYHTQLLPKYNILLIRRERVRYYVYCIWVRVKKVEKLGAIILEHNLFILKHTTFIST
jgi:uncharacterized protein YunC (DUF1805 family)